MLPAESSADQEQSQPAGLARPEKPEIDLQALAERILLLLKEEARLERERQGHPGPGGLR